MVNGDPLTGIITGRREELERARAAERSAEERARAQAQAAGAAIGAQRRAQAAAVRAQLGLGIEEQRRLLGERAATLAERQRAAEAFGVSVEELEAAAERRARAEREFQTASEFVRRQRALEQIEARARAEESFVGLLETGRAFERVVPEEGEPFIRLSEEARAIVRERPEAGEGIIQQIAGFEALAGQQIESAERLARVGLTPPQPETRTLAAQITREGVRPLTFGELVEEIRGGAGVLAPGRREAVSITGAFVSPAFLGQQVREAIGDPVQPTEAQVIGPPPTEEPPATAVTLEESRRFASFQIADPSALPIRPGVAISEFEGLLGRPLTAEERREVERQFPEIPRDLTQPIKIPRVESTIGQTVGLAEIQRRQAAEERRAEVEREFGRFAPIVEPLQDIQRVLAGRREETETAARGFALERGGPFAAGAARAAVEEGFGFAETAAAGLQEPFRRFDPRQFVEGLPGALEAARQARALTLPRVGDEVLPPPRPGPPPTEGRELGIGISSIPLFSPAGQLVRELERGRTPAQIQEEAGAALATLGIAAIPIAGPRAVSAVSRAIRGTPVDIVRGERAIVRATTEGFEEATEITLQRGRFRGPAPEGIETTPAILTEAGEQRVVRAQFEQQVQPPRAAVIGPEAQETAEQILQETRRTAGAPEAELRRLAQTPEGALVAGRIPPGLRVAAEETQEEAVRVTTRFMGRRGERIVEETITRAPPSISIRVTGEPRVLEVPGRFPVARGLIRDIEFRGVGARAGLVPAPPGVTLDFPLPVRGPPTIPGFLGQPGIAPTLPGLLVSPSALVRETEQIGRAAFRPRLIEVRPPGAAPPIVGFRPFTGPVERIGQLQPTRQESIRLQRQFLGQETRVIQETPTTVRERFRPFTIRLPPTRLGPPIPFAGIDIGVTQVPIDFTGTRTDIRLDQPPVERVETILETPPEITFRPPPERPRIRRFPDLDRAARRERRRAARQRPVFAFRDIIRPIVPRAGFAAQTIFEAQTLTKGLQPPRTPRVAREFSRQARRFGAAFEFPVAQRLPRRLRLR